MSRDEGFRIADVDVGLLDDPKVRALVRSTRDEATVARCLLAYVSVVLSSWAHGERVGLNDASPLWLTGLDELAEQLAGAGLLDASGRIPERAWASWFVPATDRREATRQRWRRAAAGRRHGGRDDVSASSPRGVIPSSPRGVPAESRAPSVPSVPSVPSSPDASGPDDSAPETEQPEAEAVTWLAQHGCYLTETSGYYRQLVLGVERHGVNAIVGRLDRLARSGVKNGDVKGFVFGAVDALDAATRPKLSALEAQDREDERAEDLARRLERTRREQIEPFLMKGETA